MEQKNFYFKTNSKHAGLAYATMICLYVFISFLGQAIVGSIFEQGTIGYTALCSIFPALAIGIVILYYWQYKRFSPTELTGIKKFNPVWLVLSFVLMIAMFLGFGFVNGLVEILIGALGLNTPKSSIKILTITDVAVYTLTLAILPAVFEEMFFRGLMLNAMSGIKRIYSIIIVSLSFALYHGSITQFFYQFIFGVGLCVLAVISKSVIACMLAHFLNNFLIILLEFFKIKIDLYNIAIIFIGLIFATVFIIVGIKCLKKERSCQDKSDRAKKFFFPFGVVGIFICILLILANLTVA